MNGKNTSTQKLSSHMFFWPVMIGATSAVGLISALVADGLWDAMSWALLAIPVALSAYFSWRKN